MTAVIGFRTKDSIIVATDSQVTRGETKQCDSKKLLSVDFKNGVSALVARSGGINGADIFQEFFEESAATVEVTHWRTIADAAEDALKRTKNKILQGAHHPLLPEGTSGDYLQAMAFEIVLAYAYAGERYLFTGDAVGALMFKSLHPFVTTGSGSNVAALILEGAEIAAMDSNDGLALAGYAIAMAKRADLYCAGPTQIGIVRSDGAAKLLSANTVKIIDDSVDEIYKKISRTLVTEIDKRFREGHFSLLWDRLAEVREAERQSLAERGRKTSK